MNEWKRTGEVSLSHGLFELFVCAGDLNSDWLEHHKSSFNSIEICLHEKWRSN